MPSHRFCRILAGILAVAGLAALGLASYGATSGPEYTVQPGDSLWAIATSHGLSVAQLASANGLDPSAVLPIGQVLVLPGTSYRPAAAVAAAGTTNPWGWCGTFNPERGPYGVLPSGLDPSTYQTLSPLFRRWAAQYGVSPSLLEAVAWQESGWQQSVQSPTGAVGVGQVEPYTAAFIQSDIVGVPLDIYSVSDNIRMSAAFLGYLAAAEGGNTCLTVAAYYEGPLNLQTYGVLPSAQQYVSDVEYLQSQFQ
jgi:LysM repeat protein